MPNILNIYFTPSLRKDGSNDYSTRGQLFDVIFNDELIVKRSHVPFCDAARALIALGHATDNILHGYHKGKDYVALKAIVGKAAALTVRDNAQGTPKFVKFVAFDHSRFNDELEAF